MGATKTVGSSIPVLWPLPESVGHPLYRATPTYKALIACMLVAMEPPKAKAVLGTRFSELSRTHSFTTAESITYQRLLRLSQPFAGQPQLGAMSTGFAKSSHQILYDVAVVFDIAPSEA